MATRIPDRGRATAANQRNRPHPENLLAATAIDERLPRQPFRRADRDPQRHARQAARHIATLRGRAHCRSRLIGVMARRHASPKKLRG
jgi:hypothetical protein